MSIWSRIADVILRRTRWILGLTVAGTLLFGASLPWLETDHGPSHFVARDSPVYQDYLAFGERFGFSRTIVYLALFDIDPFEPATVARIDSLTRRIERRQGIDYVLSLSNARLPVRRAESYGFSALVDANASRDAIARQVLSRPLYRRLLVGPDTASTVLAIKIDEQVNDTPAQVDLVREIEAEAGRLFDEPALAGMPYLKMQYARLVSSETPLFTILALIVSMLILYVALRSKRAVLLPTLVVSVGLVWILGAMALLHYRFNVVTSVLPALMVVIGMANSIHISTKYFSLYLDRGDRVQALRETIRTVGFATFLTAVTTAIGFAVLIFSGFGQLADFGLFASVSIMLLYLLSITLIPTIFLLSLPVRRRTLLVSGNRLVTGSFERLAGAVRLRTRLVFTVVAFAMVLGVAGTTRLSTDIHLFSDFSEDSRLRQYLTRFESAFGGVLPLEVVIESSSPGQFRSLRNLRALDQLQDSLSALEGVGRTVSLADMAKVANQAYFGGSVRAYRLPSAAEMPFLYTGLQSWLSEGGASLTNLPRFTDSTFSVARISIGVEDLGTTRMFALADSVRSLSEGFFPTERFRTVVTGTGLLAPISNQVLVDNLFVSLSVALIVISILMGALFRSIRLTIISLLPNFLPLLLVAGAMGFAGIVLKPSTALIFSVAFGIAVDDTIHFLAKYRMLRLAGYSVDESVAGTMRETGRAIFFTSVVLVGGFSIFVLSDFSGTSSLGALTALTLALALLSNLILLPALLFDFANRGDQRPRPAEAPREGSVGPSPSADASRSGGGSH